MLKVLFDHQKFSDQRFGGISRYFANLMQGIQKENDFQYDISVLFSYNHYIRNEKILLNNSVGSWFFKSKTKRIYKWNKKYSKYVIGKNEHDLLHPTYFDPYFIKYNKKPCAITVYDMIYERLPEHFANFDQHTYQKKQSVDYCDAVIAISESTKRDLIDLFSVREEKIRVIHLGIDTTIQTEVVRNLPGEFILFVGERHTYKNFFRFAECCAELIKKYPDLFIVFAGGGPFQIADGACIERLGLSSRCIQMNVSDEQLNYLYKKAKIFVFPSLYEGFGLPMLEAFNAGCPVAASNTSSFPEVGGNAISYFDPYDQGSMLQSIINVIDNETKKNELIAAGTERLKLFSIEKQNKETLELYASII